MISVVADFLARSQHTRYFDNQLFFLQTNTCSRLFFSMKIENMKDCFTFVAGNPLGDMKHHY